MLTRIRTCKRACATAPSGMPLLGCICYRDHLQPRRSARSRPALQAAGREQNSWGGMGVPMNMSGASSRAACRLRCRENPTKETISAVVSLFPGSSRWPWAFASVTDSEEEFDRAMDLIAHGECGKVSLLP
jgi:hypothetical protein